MYRWGWNIAMAKEKRYYDGQLLNKMKEWNANTCNAGEFLKHCQMKETIHKEI